LWSSQPYPVKQVASLFRNTISGGNLPTSFNTFFQNWDCITYCQLSFSCTVLWTISMVTITLSHAIFFTSPRNWTMWFVSQKQSEECLDNIKHRPPFFSFPEAPKFATRSIVDRGKYLFLFVPFASPRLHRYTFTFMRERLKCLRDCNTIFLLTFENPSYTFVLWIQSNNFLLQETKTEMSGFKNLDAIFFTQFGIVALKISVWTLLASSTFPIMFSTYSTMAMLSISLLAGGSVWAHHARQELSELHCLRLHMHDQGFL